MMRAHAGKQNACRGGRGVGVIMRRLLGTHSGPEDQEREPTRVGTSCHGNNHLSSTMTDLRPTERRAAKRQLACQGSTGEPSIPRMPSARVQETCASCLKFETG